jgi:hypothetical protein
VVTFRTTAAFRVASLDRSVWFEREYFMFLLQLVYIMVNGVRNVVLLSVDALRADHLSAHGYERETTPRLDGFARENARFENAYSASSHAREVKRSSVESIAA